MQVRSNRSGVLIALGIAIALSGCANIDFESEQAWFSKPLDFFGRKGGYTFSELQETKQRQRPITANDLVNGNGACQPRPAPQTPPAAPNGQAATPPAPAGDAASLLGGGVALGMSECDVVSRAGQPSSVQIGKNANGDRTAVLTYNSGPRPGIYHFERGALVVMDRIAASPPAPQVVKKKPAKSAKSAKPQKKNET